MSIKKLPEFLRQYFWDVDFDKLDLNKFRIFILEIILDRGDTRAIRWVRKNFTDKEIKSILLTSTNLSPKTANFWALFLGVNIKRVISLQVARIKQKIQSHRVSSRDLIISRYI